MAAVVTVMIMRDLKTMVKPVHQIIVIHFRNFWLTELVKLAHHLREPRIQAKIVVQTVVPIEKCSLMMVLVSFFQIIRSLIQVMTKSVSLRHVKLLRRS